MLENRPAFLFHWFALNALGVERRADQRRDALGRARVPDRPQRDRASRSMLPRPRAPTCARPRSLRRAARALRMARGRRRRDRGRIRCRRRCGPPRAPMPIGRDDRVRAALHLGHDRPAEGLHASTNAYFLHVGRWYADIGDVCSVRPDRERIITPLPLNHVNAMCFSLMAIARRRRLPDPARPLPSADLVAERARQPRDDHPLPRRDAGDADRRRAVARRSRARGALGLRRRRRRARTTRRSRRASAFR